MLIEKAICGCPIAFLTRMEFRHHGDFLAVKTNPRAEDECHELALCALFGVNAYILTIMGNTIFE
jgi:hypothetical protein